MNPENTKTLYSAKAYQEGDLWRGIVVGIDDRPVIWSTMLCKKESRAILEAMREFEKSLYSCKHAWDKWDEHTEDTEFAGLEYVAHHDCKNCGLRNYHISDKSIFDSFD